MKPTANGSESGKRRVLIVDDHPMVRERLAELINKEPDLKVVGEVADAYAAREAADKLQPDVALIDISLKDSYGIELVKDLKAQDPKLLMLVVSMHDESIYAERALKAGARGYLSKQEASTQVIGAIRKILRGDLYLSEEMAGVILGRVAGHRTSSGAPAERLTDREMEIFQLLGEGLAVREIAKRLHISAKTVEAHRANMKEKLNVKTSPELLRYAIQSAVRANQA